METNKKFKCKDEVIYRSPDSEWYYGIFSHYQSQGLCFKRAIINGNHYDLKTIEILPYEGNEHLVGTDLPAEEEIRLEEGEWVMYAFGGLVSIYPLDYNLGKFIKINEGDNNITIQDSDAVRGISKFIRFSDFNPNDMEETSRHILCVKGGKVVRYKNN